MDFSLKYLQRMHTRSRQQTGQGACGTTPNNPEHMAPPFHPLHTLLGAVLSGLRGGFVLCSVPTLSLLGWATPQGLSSPTDYSSLLGSGSPVPGTYHLVLVVLASAHLCIPENRARRFFGISESSESGAFFGEKVCFLFSAVSRSLT